MNTIYSPPDLYLNGEYKLSKGSYTWYTKEGELLNADTIDILDFAPDVKASSKLYVTLNQESQTDNLYAFPDDIEITCKILKEGKTIKVENATKVSDMVYKLHECSENGKCNYLLFIRYKNHPNLDSSYAFNIEL